MDYDEYEVMYGEHKEDMMDYDDKDFCIQCGSKLRFRYNAYPYGNASFQQEEKYCRYCEDEM